MQSLTLSNAVDHGTTINNVGNSTLFTTIDHDMMINDVESSSSVNTVDNDMTTEDMGSSSFLNAINQDLAIKSVESLKNPENSIIEHIRVDSSDPAYGVKSASINNGPYQPKESYKLQQCQGKSRHFRDSWYSDFPWLEYSIVKDSAFCYSCRFFCHEKSSRGEENFTKIGVSNWKKALEKFRKHEKSEMHLKSTQFWIEKKAYWKHYL